MMPDMKSAGFTGAENANVPIGGPVAVFGIGPVGLCSIAGAKLRGAGRIFAVGTRPKPIKIAKAYGATDTISYKEGDTTEQILEKTDSEGVGARGSSPAAAPTSASTRSGRPRPDRSSRTPTTSARG